MVGTRSTRSQPQPFPTEENTRAAVPPKKPASATPRKTARGRKRATRIAEADEAAKQDEVVEAVPALDYVAEENGDADRVALAGDKMELDTEQVGNAEALGEVDRPMGEADAMEGATTTTADTSIAVDRTTAADTAAVDTTATTGDLRFNGLAAANVKPDQAAEESSQDQKERQTTPMNKISTNEPGDGLAPGSDPEVTAVLNEVEIRRSARKRVAPTVLDESLGKAIKTKAGARARAWKADGGDEEEEEEEEEDEDSEWEEEYLMTNPGSVYASNLGDFFNPGVWERFSEAEKKHLMTFLPECDKAYPTSTDVTDPTTPKAELVEGFWENPQLQSRISNVENDIAEGKYTPANQAAIIEARKRSESGEFNQFKDNKFEQFWGQKQRVNYEAVAGDTSGVKVRTLAKHHAIRVGDVFSLRRSFRGGAITVEKDAKLIAIDPDDFSFTFSYPPGKLQVSSDQRPDKVISGVISITALETLLCKEDGRAPSKLPNGNAWKTFRITRNEQDIGSLFDVRAEFHAKYLSSKAD